MVQQLSTGMRIISLYGLGNLAEKCHRMSIDALHSAKFMSNHSSLSVQTICLLIYVGHNLGQSDEISVLLSCGIRIAQSLGLHRLGPDSLSRPVEGISALRSLVSREVNKRTWWFLIRQDWLQIPFLNTYSIHPTQFNTPMPRNCFEDIHLMAQNNQIVEQEPETYTQSSYTSVLNHSRQPPVS